MESENHHQFNNSSSTMSSSSSLNNRLKLFEDFCSRINLDTLTKTEAWKLLERFYALDMPTQENELVWPVCAIYLLSTNSVLEVKENIQSAVHLSQLLRECNLRLYDFFSPLQNFVGVFPQAFRDKVVERLQHKYIVVSLAFQKYSELFSKLFKIELERYQESFIRKNPIDRIFKFGWVMFSLAQSKLLVNTGDFLQSLQLLLCCVNLLLIHMPDPYRKRPLKDHYTSENSDTLHYLCSQNYANYKQVKDMQERIFNAWIQSLCANSILKYQPAKVPPDTSLTDLFYLGGLLDSFLDENEKKLDREFEEFLYENCDFDERLFIEGNQQLQSPMRPTKKPPIPHKEVTMTPARQILMSDNWLITNFSNVNSFTPAYLSNFGIANPNEIVQSLNSRIEKLMGDIDFQTDNSLRKSLVIKLFYSILESALETEYKRLEKHFDAAFLLSNELFNKSLLAGCLEIVISTYHSSFMTFPYVIQKFGLFPYDFYTIIDTIISNIKPILPAAIKKHLIRVEERILEELAWHSASPIYSSLNEQRPLLRQRLDLVKQHNLAQNACQSFASPSKEHSLTINKRLDKFTRKVAYLAYIRIKELVVELNTNSEKIKIHPPVTRQIEYTFMYIMINTLLFQNRHLDQLLMCVLYSVCKINSISVSFKQIVEAYRIIPHSNSQIFRMVRLKDDKGDIIKFYNAIFLEEMESFLMQLGVAEGHKEESTDNNNNPVINLRVCSPLRLHKSPQTIRNLVVSPLRKTLPLSEEGSSLVLGSLKSPQSEFNKINNFISNRSLTPRTKRKLDYGTEDYAAPPTKNQFKSLASKINSSFIVSPSMIPTPPQASSSKEDEDMDEEDDEEEDDDEIDSDEDIPSSPEKTNQPLPHPTAVPPTLPISNKSKNNQ